MTTRTRSYHTDIIVNYCIGCEHKTDGICEQCGYPLCANCEVEDSGGLCEPCAEADEEEKVRG